MTGTEHRLGQPLSQQEQGFLVVISGPSASGKGTVNRFVLDSGEFVYSISATTRAPRAGEIDGVNYRFVSKAYFESLIENDGVLEYTTYCGEYYGTPRREAEEVLRAGKNLLLEIEVDGAGHIKEKFPDAILIMLLPPSYREQEKRLRSRGSETEEKIQRRLTETRNEMKRIELYDYIVYNETGRAEEAAKDILAIVRAEKCARRRHPDAAERYFAE